MRRSLVVLTIWAVTATAHADSQLPDVRSKAAMILDARTGAELFGKDADEVRAIASTTKIFVAMVVRKKGIALDDYTEITRADFKAARGGARTRLDIGQKFKNVDLLRAMLMASDNRAPTALARAVGLDADGLVEEMNALAKDLGLKKTRFTDTSGLRGNVSTAREMAIATRAVLDDDLLREIMATETYEVKSESGYAKLTYVTTNQPLVEHKYKVVGGKTGYTTSAGYCFVTGAEIGGREVVMSFLGADGKLTRFADFDRVAAWLDLGAPGAKVAYRAKRGKTKPVVAVKASGTIDK
jgi:serine-type D-Ala-D-Ala endopeptidase (penicillin-binding protein 7)